MDPVGHYPPVALDLLAFNGSDLRLQPLVKRQERLQVLLERFGCPAVRTIRRRPGASARGRGARLRRRYEQAPQCALSVGRVPGPAQGQDDCVARCQSGAVAIARARWAAQSSVASLNGEGKNRLALFFRDDERLVFQPFSKKDRSGEAFFRLFPHRVQVLKVHALFITNRSCFVLMLKIGRFMPSLAAANSESPSTYLGCNCALQLADRRLSSSGAITPTSGGAKACRGPKGCPSFPWGFSVGGRTRPSPASRASSTCNPQGP